MKKSLLTILCAVAMVATANADNAPLKGKKFGTPFDGKTAVKMENVQEWPADKELPASVQAQMKAQKAKAAAKASKISSLQELEKGYSIAVKTYDGNIFNVTDDSDIEYGEYNSYSYVTVTGRSGIKIYGFTYGFDVEGTVDVAEGTVELPVSQVVMVSPTYGPYCLVVFFYDEETQGTYYTTNYVVYGYVAEDGSIVFDNMDYLECYGYLLTEGDYAGYSLVGSGDWCLNTTLTINDQVALQIDAVEPEDEAAEDFDYQYYPVVVTKNGNELTIDNFAGYGYVFNATVAENADGTLAVSIPSQLCGSATGGDFFTYGMDMVKWDDDDLWEVATSLRDFATEDDAIVGVAEGATITLDPWCQYSPAPAYANYTWDGLRYGTIIQLNAPLSDMTGINSVNNATAKSNEWYTINGVRLSGKPAVKGLYINNGKKVLIK